LVLGQSSVPKMMMLLALACFSSRPVALFLSPRAFEAMAMLTRGRVALFRAPIPYFQHCHAWDVPLNVWVRAWYMDFLLLEQTRHRQEVVVASSPMQ
jgi:hypothetical protein